MPFQKGQSGNPDGRPPGSENKVRKTMRELAERILLNPKVQDRLEKLAEQGKLSPRFMIELGHYLSGDPPKTIHVEKVQSDPERRAALKLMPEEKRYLLADLLLEWERLQEQIHTSRR
jgi:hypothetical protein